jgi:hypothetical protein
MMMLWDPVVCVGPWSDPDAMASPEHLPLFSIDTYGYVLAHITYHTTTDQTTHTQT